jgi:hypothetical protein
MHHDEGADDGTGAAVDTDSAREYCRLSQVFVQPVGIDTE